jgi:hypothetical protein
MTPNREYPQILMKSEVRKRTVPMAEMRYGQDGG